MAQLSSTTVYGDLKVTGKITTNSSDVVLEGQVRNIFISASDPDVSVMSNGDIHIKYI